MPPSEVRAAPFPLHASPNRLKLPQLRLIAAIEAAGSVSAAAQALNLSQPAASRAIAEMEASFGAALCERLARGVRLTPLGAALARHARSVLLQLAEAERELDDLKLGRRGAVALGAVSGPAFALAPRAVLRLGEVAPEIELSLKIDSSNVLARDLLAGDLDLLLARVPDDLDPEAFDAEPAGVEEARLVVRAGHPLLARGRAGLKDLSACDWVMQPRGTPLRRAMETMFHDARLAAPRRVLATTSLTMTMMTVAQTDAVAAVSAEVAAFVCGETGTRALAQLPVSFPLMVQPYSLIRARRRPLGPAASAVYDTIRRLIDGR